MLIYTLKALGDCGLKVERSSDSTAGKIYIWFYLYLNCTLDAKQSMGAASLFPFELEELRIN